MLIVLLAAAAATSCPPIQLATSGLSPRFTAKVALQTRTNFGKAYKAACSEGMFNRRPLITANGANAGKLFLVNAPDANVASIYPGNGRMLLEYWFVDHKGKASAPAVNELHEAIYCAVHGASAKEQEESGRCLPD
jgi:hypothetical protein